MLRRGGLVGLIERILRDVGGDGVGHDRGLAVEALRLRRRGIGDGVEAERFGGKAGAFMGGIGDHRSRVGFGGERGTGKAACGAKREDGRGQRRGAEGMSH